MMAKGTQLNIRVTPQIREQLSQIAEYHGLSVSSYVHSLLVRELRKERESFPDAFILPPTGTMVKQGGIINANNKTKKTG